MSLKIYKANYKANYKVKIRHKYKKILLHFFKKWIYKFLVTLRNGLEIKKLKYFLAQKRKA
jgi:hypothetical protein